MHQDTPGPGRAIHLYTGRDGSVLRGRRLAGLARMGVQGVWLRIDRADQAARLGSSPWNAGLRARSGGRPGAEQRAGVRLVLYTEDPALVEPILNRCAARTTPAAGMALPFGIAGELEKHASLLGEGSYVCLTDFQGKDAAGLARSVRRLRGAAARVEPRALLFHPRTAESYRRNLRLRDLLANGPPLPQVIGLAAGGRAAEGAGRGSGVGAGEENADGPGDMLFECALRAGALLYEGIGDTLLILPDAGEPGAAGAGMSQAEAAISSLGTVMGELGLVPRAYTIVSCPTCGRCVMDIPAMAEKTGRMLERVTGRYRERGRAVEQAGGITVAVMGCNVNGPGEARAADVGIAGGRGGTGTLFRGGRPVATLPERELIPALEEQVVRIIEEKLGRVEESSG